VKLKISINKPILKIRIICTEVISSKYIKREPGRETGS